MRLLADTHVLVWAVSDPQRLSRDVQDVILDPATRAVFSVVSIWELVIKAAKRPRDFDLDPRATRRNLLDQGWEELSVTAEHALAVATLPPLHGDPFDRMLIAQATVEGALLLTSDRIVARYPGPVRLV